MAWLICIGVFVMLLMFLVAMTNVHISLQYHRRQGDDAVTIRLRVWRFLTYTYHVPKLAVDEDTVSLNVKTEREGEASKRKLTAEDMLSRWRTVQRFLENVADAHRVVKQFFSRITVSRLAWTTRFGLGDAAWTGMAAGAIWAAKGNIVGLIGHYMQLEKTPELSVDPVFQAEYMETELSCMFSFRIGHAMKAAFAIVTFWKGRQPAWQKEKEKDRDIRSKV